MSKKLNLLLEIVFYQKSEEAQLKFYLLERQNFKLDEKIITIKFKFFSEINYIIILFYFTNVKTSISST